MPKRLWWHLCGRFFEARAARALKNYNAFQKKAASFFHRLDGGRD